MRCKISAFWQKAEIYVRYIFIFLRSPSYQKKQHIREGENPPILHIPPFPLCYNKRVGWRNKAIGWHPYWISKHNKDIYAHHTSSPENIWEKLKENS